MTPNSLKANLTKTIHIHEKPRVSLESVNNKSIPEYSNEAELLSRVSQLLEKDLDLLMSDREGDRNRRCDVLELLCSKIENIKGELNNVNKRNQTLCRQKLVCTSCSVKFLALTGAQEMLICVLPFVLLVQTFLRLFRIQEPSKVFKRCLFKRKRALYLESYSRNLEYVVLLLIKENICHKYRFGTNS